MKFLMNLKISYKLAALVAVILVGFLAIDLTYKSGLEVENTALARAERINDFGLAVEDAYVKFLEARRYEKELPLYKAEKYIGRHAERVVQMNEILAPLAPSAPSPKAKQDIAQMLPLLDKYDADMKVFADALLRLGLDENTGLHGAMRKSVHAVEASLNQLDDPRLGRSMLMMRRHEKDFLQRENDKYVTKMHGEQDAFATLLGETNLSGEAKAEIANQMADYLNRFIATTEGVKAMRARESKLRAAAKEVSPIFNDLLAEIRQLRTESSGQRDAESDRISTIFLGLLALTALLILAVLGVIALSITKPLAALQRTVQKVTAGDLGARTRLTTGDELGELGRAFDNLLDERMVQFERAQEENEQLNESVIGLLQGVARLSQKDLTVRIPVTEDVTGPVADALNLFTNETAKVLQDVNQVSHEVALASSAVKAQSDSVISVASTEQEQVNKTAEELAAAAEAMDQIAALAQASNATADNAIMTTQTALETVTSTVKGISGIRDTIRETEKRIKRLGERSQEITGVVNLINSIAERTHILALNASMHAASAGEAGRGFAVVADEVQRLAENAREATSQISTLVNNIQVETADTVNTMNTAISQVVEGSRLAEQAGEQMEQTRKTTAKLVESVGQIASSSTVQAQVGNALQERAREIQASTEQTSQQLKEQTLYTSRLVKYSQGLLNTVRVFSLPDESAGTGATVETLPIRAASNQSA